MVRISVTVDGAGMRRLRRLADAFMTEAVRRVAEDVQRGVIANLSGSVLKVRTGSLRRAWARQPRVTVVGGEVGATLGANLVYAAIHEFGGQIVPKRARFLKFQADDGRWVRTRLVTMPARRYASLAIADTERRVPRIVDGALEAVAARLGV